MTVWILLTNRYAESFEKIEMKDTKLGTLAKNYIYMCVVRKLLIFQLTVDV